MQKRRMPSLLHTSLMLSFFFLFPKSLSLSTSNRWIVDDSSGRRVKLACVSWPSHLQPMVAEGLNKRPLDGISKSIVAMGFNCVRFTWPLYLVTNASLVNVTVRESLMSLGLDGAVSGVQVNNPGLLDQTLVGAFTAVVTNLGENKIMAILDNHISKPGWCCNNTDGNGFFGDEFFNPDEWIMGLTQMATMFNGVANVVGMSLRNELRGPKQNVPEWYRYMQKGAEAVHKSNPNVLVIISGLNFDSDLSFLSTKKLELSFGNKLVHELHWYAFSDGQTWKNSNPNDACGMITSSVMSRAGFLLSQGVPLILSEWGVDLRGGNLNDNRYLGCVLGSLAELDMDWSLWALQGSYYLRDGTMDLEEVYGALDLDWLRPRSPAFLQKIAALQYPLQGPGLNSPSYTILFHPSSGLCIVQENLNSPLHLGLCNRPRAWTYTEQQTIQLLGTNLCLKASAGGQPVELQNYSNNDLSLKWDLTSGSKMHISPRLGNNSCLDVGSDSSTLVTNPCRCLSKDQTCDPEGQWFKMVPSTKQLY